MKFEHIIKDSGVVILSRIAMSVNNLLFLPLITKTLGETDYGIWAQTWTSIGLSLALLNLGFPLVMSRLFQEKGQKERAKDFYSNLVPITIGTITISAILYIFSNSISSVLFGDNSEVVKLLAIVIFVWSISSYFLEALRALKKIKFYALIHLIQGVSEMLLAAILVLKGGGIEGAILGLVVVRTAVMFCVVLYVPTMLTITRPEYKPIKQYLHYGVPLITSNMSKWILSSSDRYLIAIILGTTYVGYYEPGYLLGKWLPYLLAGTISVVLPPSLATLYERGDIEEVKRTTSMILKLFLMAVIPFIGGSVIIASRLLEFISTETIANKAAYIVPMVGCGLMFYGIKIIYMQTLLLEKRTMRIGITYAVSAILNVILNLMLIPYMGIMGAAIATCVAYGIDLIITLIWTKDRITPPLEIHSLVKIIFATSLMMIIMECFNTVLNIHNLSILILIGVISYVIVLWILKGFSGLEEMILKNISLKDKLEN